MQRVNQYDGDDEMDRRMPSRHRRAVPQGSVKKASSSTTCTRCSSQRTCSQNEQKQVTLLEAKNVKLAKKLIFYGQMYWYRGKYGQVQSNQKVGVYLDIKNSKEQGLGMPLPKGIVRVYKADKSGAKQFIGEDSIDHTPRDEKLRIKMGEAFDVVGDRKQMAWHTLGVCISESTWEIELRNHKDQAAQVEVYEPVGGDWDDPARAPTSTRRRTLSRSPST